MTISDIENWVTAHGLPMVITLLVIYIIFKYFLKQIDNPTKSCKPSIEALKTDIKNLDAKIESQTSVISSCQKSLLTLQGFLSGVYFRNRGSMDDE